MAKITADNMGDKPTIDIPRQPIANNPEAEVIRMLDGHASPGSEGDQDDDLRNPHMI